MTDIAVAVESARDVGKLTLPDGNVLFRSGQPVHVANAILFLASDDAAHITGQDMLVDGGHSIAGNLSQVPGMAEHLGIRPSDEE
jgi:NAD(P)-dependent dehydrogenase (short-subunit alcohol dehydrogenase family)